MGDDIIRVVPSFLHGGGTISYINHTSIILIPKIKKLENMTQFRPISPCNVLHKIISKIMANRLKSILPLIILELKVPLYGID